jgi:hypothetical protein
VARDAWFVRRDAWFVVPSPLPLQKRRCKNGNAPAKPRHRDNWEVGMRNSERGTRSASQFVAFRSAKVALLSLQQKATSRPNHAQSPTPTGPRTVAGASSWLEIGIGTWFSDRFSQIRLLASTNWIEGHVARENLRLGMVFLDLGAHIRAVLADHAPVPTQPLLILVTQPLRTDTHNSLVADDH